MAASAIPIGGRQNLSVDQTRAELQRHFNTFQGEKYGEGWNELWNKGDFLPWDRGAPSPALIDALINHKEVFGSAIVDNDGQSRRKSALVPGCGRGVDVLLLQSFGYDVVGLEISTSAVKEAEKWSKEHAAEYKTLDAKLGRGTARFVEGDFFANDWKERIGFSKDQPFDLIYDYTFFCALNPSMRPRWAKRMTELLADSPQANLICLEFPTEKPTTAGGPPFSSPPKAYMEHLSHPGEQVPYDQDGNVRMNPLGPSTPGALERVGHWQPADTHTIGKDEDGRIKDWIAVWRRR